MAKPVFPDSEGAGIGDQALGIFSGSVGEPGGGDGARRVERGLGQDPGSGAHGVSASALYFAGIPQRQADGDGLLEFQNAIHGYHGEPGAVDALLFCGGESGAVGGYPGHSVPARQKENSWNGGCSHGALCDRAGELSLSDGETLQY